MVYFSPEQRLQILRSTDTRGGTQSEIDQKYGNNGSDDLVIVGELDGPIQRSSQDTPPLQTVIVREPPQHTMSAPPTSRPDQQPGSSFEFDCPVDSSECLERIPREDVTVAAQMTAGKDEVKIDLDNARGMKLCHIRGLLQVDMAEDPPGGFPSEVEQQQFWDMLFFAGEWSLIFRDQRVQGFKSRSLGDLVNEPGCCESKTVHVGCTVPQYGAMSIKLNLSGVVLPPWVEDVRVLTRTYFSGCNCPRPDCGCGCGGGPTTQNPFIQNYSGVIETPGTDEQPG